MELIEALLSSTGMITALTWLFFREEVNKFYESMGRSKGEKEDDARI